MDTNDTTSSIPNEQVPLQEEELSHSDKMIGVFTEPGKTFEKTSLFPARTIDWFLPMLILLVLVAISQIILLNNPEIAYQVRQKAVERIEQNFSEAVKNGQMTQEQADQQMDRILEQMDQGRGTVGMIIQSVSILVIGFIIFFIMAGLHFFFAKVVFKGEGVYASSLVANGLSAYIGIVAVILGAILSLVLGKMLPDLSVASFFDSDKSEFMGWILGKLDIITIWTNVVLSIGLAKMFRSKSMMKYFLMVFGIWILGSLLFWGLAKAFPFLGWFMG
jgi:hypothetical protein